MTQVNSKRIAKNTLMLYGRMAISMMVSLYTSRVILEALGFTDFGIYNVVGGIVIVFSTLTASLSGATARFITVELGKEDHSNLANVFSTAAWLHIAISLLIVLLSESVGIWFLNTQLDIPSDRMYAANWLFQFSVIAAALSFTQVPYTAAMIAHEKMDIFAYVGLFTSFGGLLIAFLIYYEPFDRLIWYGALTLLLNVLSLLISRWYCVRKFAETRLRKVNDKPLAKEMIKFGGYDLVGNISVMAQGQGLNIVLNMFFGPTVNAARAIAYWVQGVIQQFSTSFTTAVRPQIYKLYTRGEYTELIKLMTRCALLTYMLLLLVIVPVMANLNEVLSLWLNKFPEYSVYFTAMVLVNSLFTSFGTTRLMVFHASGNIKAYSLSSGLIMTAALPIGYILLKLGYPPQSIFWGMLATTVAADINSLVLLKKYLDYSVMAFIKDVHCKCFACTAISIGAAFAMKYILATSHTLIALIASTLAAWITITAFIWLFALTSSQKHTILKRLHLAA